MGRIRAKNELISNKELYTSVYFMYLMDPSDFFGDLLPIPSNWIRIIIVFSDIYFTLFSSSLITHIVYVIIFYLNLLCFDIIITVCAKWSIFFLVMSTVHSLTTIKNKMYISIFQMIWKAFSARFCKIWTFLQTYSTLNQNNWYLWATICIKQPGLQLKCL